MDCLVKLVKLEWLFLFFPNVVAFLHGTIKLRIQPATHDCDHLVKQFNCSMKLLSQLHVTCDLILMRFLFFFAFSFFFCCFSSNEFSRCTENPIKSKCYKFPRNKNTVFLLFLIVLKKRFIFHMNENVIFTALYSRKRWKGKKVTSNLRLPMCGTWHLNDY